MSPADWIIICWFQATPTLLSSFGSSLMCNSLLSPDSDLRALVIGGEQCPSGSVLRSWKANGNKTRLINIYGVTEVSCWATWYEITADDLQLSQFASSYSFVSFINKYVGSSIPSVLWRCWLGGRKGIRPVKNWVVGCWHGYLSGARCRLACGPADTTATHCLLLQ